jgi:hypothetical protein
VKLVVFGNCLAHGTRKHSDENVGLTASTDFLRAALHPRQDAVEREPERGRPS